MELIYNHLHNNGLLNVLKNEEINQSLAYMLDFKEHLDLKVTPKPFSIEIANNEITIAVLLYVGFEGAEYGELKTKPNVHIVSFNKVSQTMCEFEALKIKHIDYLSLFFMSLSRSKNSKLLDYQALKNLGLGGFNG
jgi:hypothetical protein